jgi:5-methylcytosine-specific restriction endonuclease McrA|nr:MAG TPA: NinG recombination protein [Bacteriophage sp.]
MENKIYKLSDEQFVELLKKSSTISEVLFKLGYTVKGNSWGYSQVKRRMDDLNLDYSIFKGKSAITKTNKLNNVKKEDILKENCKHQRIVLRRYIIKNNLIPYKCAICGCTEWQGKTLSLELDHINGINNDNRLENLRFLCPNCHSQTSTYGSRNQQLNSSEYDISDDLRKMVEEKYNEVKSVKKVSSILGIRRCVVTKIVNESGQKHSNQKYIIRYDKDWNELARYGSLVEAAKALIEANEVKTKRVKTCTRTIMYNKDNFWLNSHWKILDGSGIINNPLLEPSLIDSEDNVDEAQAKAA